MRWKQFEQPTTDAPPTEDRRSDIEMHRQKDVVIEEGSPDEPAPNLIGGKRAWIENVPSKNPKGFETRGGHVTYRGVPQVPIEGEPMQPITPQQLAEAPRVNWDSKRNQERVEFEELMASSKKLREEAGRQSALPRKYAMGGSVDHVNKSYRRLK
jgi:hypothetical protein